MLKVFVLVPKENVDTLIDAMANAGAGVLGNYSHNAFVTDGTGNWKSEEGAHPTIGEVGKLSKEPESKVEMLCSEEKLEEVVKAIRSVHPYEEPAIDIIQLFSHKS